MRLRDPDEKSQVREMLRTPAGRLILREMTAELQTVLGPSEAGAVNFSNGRRSLALEFIDLMAETHDGSDDHHAEPNPDAAVAARHVVRGRIRAAAAARRAARSRGGAGT